MTDQDRIDKVKKSVGQDPFVDLEDFDLEAPDLSGAAADSADETGSEPQETADEPAEPVITADEPAEPVILAADEPADVEFASKSGDAPDEAVDHLLDELISAIDGEVEQTFGRLSMPEPGSEERPPPQTVKQEQYVIFSLAGARYAASVANIREMSEATWLTPVPNTPVWLLGVTNLRGDILSVVDLQRFLALKQVDDAETTGLQETLSGPEQEILVAHVRRELITVGFTVDIVSDIRYLDVNKIATPGASLDAQIAPYLQGVYEDGDHFLIVLDFEKLLLSPALRQFEPV